jgi:hypothetical protein
LILKIKKKEEEIMAKKTKEPFDPSAWLNEAPATKEEKREKRKAEREEKKAESNKKAKIPEKKTKGNDNKFNMKYGIFVGACVIALASSGAWAWISHNGNEKYNAEMIATAQSEVQKAKEEAEQEEEKKYSLTKEEYEKNVDTIIKGIKTLTKKDNGDLKGYFTSNNKFYKVITYDRETGQLYVEETDDKNKDKEDSNGKPLTLNKEWINTLVVRLEAQNN